MSVTLRKKRNNQLVQFEIIDLLKNVKRIDSINNTVRINGEVYVLSSIVDLASATLPAPVQDDVRLSMIGNTVHLQRYDNSAWVNTGTSWDVVGS